MALPVDGGRQAADEGGRLGGRWKRDNLHFNCTRKRLALAEKRDIAFAFSTVYRDVCACVYVCMCIRIRIVQVRLDTGYAASLLHWAPLSRLRLFRPIPFFPPELAAAFVYTRVGLSKVSRSVPLYHEQCSREASSQVLLSVPRLSSPVPAVLDINQFHVGLFISAEMERDDRYLDGCV